MFPLSTESDFKFQTLYTSDNDVLHYIIICYHPLTYYSHIHYTNINELIYDCCVKI